MGSRSQHQKQIRPSISTSDSAPISAFSRPFATPTQTTAQPDLQAQLDHSLRFGHSLSNFSLAPAAPIQPKLTIGAVGDKYEQEADRVASQVVSSLHTPQPAPEQTEQKTVQRSETPEEEEMQRKPDIQRMDDLEDEEEMQRKPDIQRMDDLEDEEEMQRKPDIQCKRTGAQEAAPELESSIQQARGGGQPIAPSVRGPMEEAFGADFGAVRVHTDSQADQLSRSIQAQAFTSKQDIFFQQGTFNPNSRNGQELLAHELTHTIQQGAATKAPAAQKKPAPNLSQISVSSAPTDAVQCKGNTQQIAQAKQELSDLRQNVLNKLASKAWPQALENFNSLNYAYTKSGAIERTGLAKKIMGLSTLNTRREKAKKLRKQRDTKPVTTLLDEVAATANDTSKDSRTIADGSAISAAKMTGKIAFYLIETIPASVKAISTSFSSINPDLTTVLGGGGGGGGGGHVIAPPKSTKVTTDEGDINNALTSGQMDTRGFHGSASWLLEGLGKSGGKLLSQQAAFDAGLLKTGEGTTFSSGAALKKDVYIGEGATGFGTSASYAMAPGELTSYNVSLFSDVDLASTIASYQKIIQLEGALKLMDSNLASSGKEMVHSKMMALAKQAGIDPATDEGYKHLATFQNTVQLKEMLSKLAKEQEARKSWPKTDPRRNGGQQNPDNYPILLEFDLGGLTVTQGNRTRQQGGDYRVAGESTVANEIDLTNGRLKVVYCPEQFIAKTRTQIDKVFGKPNTIAIRAMEAVKGGITGGSDTDKTLQATYGQLEKQQKTLDIRLKTQKDLADNLPLPTTLTNKDGRQFDQKTGTGGTVGYVATDQTTSMAKDPAFETKALAFEQRLGAFAFQHAKANTVAKTMCDKIKTYLDERDKLVKTLDTKIQQDFKGSDAYARIGDINKRLAGNVGKDITDIKAVLASGNLRERMTHIHNFTDRVLHGDLELDTHQTQVQQLLQTADIDETEGRAHKEIPRDDVMDQRDETRFRSGQNTNSDSTVKSLSDAGVGLSDREKKLTNAQNNGDKVNWNEGAKMWLMNEANTWVQTQRELSIPLMAGPSGHTNSLMRAAKALKITDLADVRLAIIGHLVPIRAHSLVEIMAAAKPHGVPYKQGQEMYTDIAPLTDSELKTNVCTAGKYPHEK